MCVRVKRRFFPRKLLIYLLLAALLGSCCLASGDAPAVKKLSLSVSSRELLLSGDSPATARLTVSATPKDADLTGLVWRSSNESVATVSDAAVTAYKGGSVKITVVDTRTNVKASCTIKVYNSPQSVSLSPYMKSIRQGRTFRIQAKITPTRNIRKAEKAIAWFSSDVTVATVDAKGNVKAISPGEARITAMTVNGLTDTCDVTVVS